MRGEHVEKWKARVYVYVGDREVGEVTNVRYSVAGEDVCAQFYAPASFEIKRTRKNRTWAERAERPYAMLETKSVEIPDTPREPKHNGGADNMPIRFLPRVGQVLRPHSTSKDSERFDVELVDHEPSRGTSGLYLAQRKDRTVFAIEHDTTLDAYDYVRGPKNADEQEPAHVRLMRWAESVRPVDVSADRWRKAVSVCFTGPSYRQPLSRLHLAAQLEPVLAFIGAEPLDAWKGCDK